MTQTFDPADLPRALDDKTWLLVLTGAGVSAESGLPTFRASDGLWENHHIEDVASPDGFRRDPELVWRFYGERRAGASRVEPNAGHLALAELERRLGERFLLVTQNVDGLHGRAGSRRYVELHGSLWRTRCSSCDLVPFEDHSHPVEPPLPTCPNCGALLRPDIVWFGEAIPYHGDFAVREHIYLARLAKERLVFLAAGTSGNVWPASSYVSRAADAGAETWLADPGVPANRGAFDRHLRGPATVVLPALVEAFKPSA